MRSLTRSLLATASPASGESIPAPLRVVWTQPALWLVLLLALAVRLALIQSGSITFNSDEAVMSLIARHILSGEFTAFYWGQNYMGVLDSYLLAGFFALFGQTVLTARLAALSLYLMTVLTTYLLAYRLSEDGFAAAVAALLLALPPVMVVLYTSISIGAFIDILVLNNLLFLIGWDLIAGRRGGWGWWALAGLLGGIGWWELPIIAASILPLLTVGVWRLKARLPWGKLAVAAVAFLIGASPWIARLIAAPGGVAGDLVGVRLSAAASARASGTGLLSKLVSLLFFNLPALVGLRPPWAVEWVWWPLGVLFAALYMAILWQAARQLKRQPDYQRLAISTLLLAWVVIILPFLLSPFGSDPTGRYLMVLYPTLAVLTGHWLGRLRRGQGGLSSRTGRWLAPAVLIGLLAYNSYGTIRYTLETPPGLSTQLLEQIAIPHDTDEDLFHFLGEIGATRGYANYWIAYRTIFLTGESVILSPQLPYRENLDYTTRDDRYPPYTELVDSAADVVYVTAKQPALDEALRQGFDALAVTYQEEQIGPYTVFYDLSRTVRATELDIYGQVTGNEIYDQ